MKPLPKFLLVIGCALTIFTPASSSQTGDFADVDTIYGRSDKQQKSIGSISGELVTDSGATNTAASGIENDLYIGKKRGLLSVAFFYVRIDDTTALLEQYREFGAPLYKDLTDTLYKKNARLFVGEWTFLELTSKGIFLKNKEELRWKLNIKLSPCSDDERMQYDIYQNRLLLETLNFQDISPAIYRPLVNKAFKMNHEAFKIEVGKFLEEYPEANKPKSPPIKK